ncbi:membrane protein [Legionella norrlandica]|uniref:Guanidinium exporter n=1 Tax=Legionella norrlandica TaxID=1498499 RepID=A0A0A2SM60_9GAMM|nr:SMR family transporter [Legionella norrlandica]KGP62235.1 membrane protein [Legionella norrlandica]
MFLPWLYLFVAGFLEVCWAVGLKYTDGFSKWMPSLFTGTALLISMLLLAKAAQSLPIGTAYAVWVGIGALGTAIMGILLFQEPISLFRLIFLILLFLSIFGLKYTA